MTKLPVVKPLDCIRALQGAGFLIDQQKGSHVILTKSDNTGKSLRTTVPRHSKTMKPGPLRLIIKDAGLTVTEFIELAMTLDPILETT
jgi:predicted RNA binding protein YcfA (HicA-like mRNA interferase family)